MPNVTLTVTLKNGSLDVDEAGNGNQISHGETSTITWELTGNAASGSFNAIDGASPGFAWVQSPPQDVFGTPTLQANGNQIQMSDNNTSSNSIGSWIYQLHATIGGAQYSTIANNRVATVTNPTIQNK